MAAARVVQECTEKVPEPPPHVQTAKGALVPVTQVAPPSLENCVRASPPLVPEALPSGASGSAGDGVMVQGPACHTPRESSPVTGGVASMLTSVLRGLSAT
jgi:hypothetical protein